HRGGGGYDALPQPQARRRAQDGADARQPGARRGCGARDRAPDGLARAAGPPRRGVPPDQGRSPRARPPRHGGAAARLVRGDPYPRRAPRGGAEALERAAAEERDAGAQQRDAEARLEALAAEGTPLDRMVEEAKDAVVEASAEESRLHNMGEALRRRHEELEGRRRKLEDEQRLRGERLRANGRDAEAAREAITRLEEERLRLGAEREVLAERQLEIRREEAARGTALEGAREAARQIGSRADSLRELHARHEGCKRGAAGLLARQPGTAALL